MGPANNQGFGLCNDHRWERSRSPDKPMMPAIPSPQPKTWKLGQPQMAVDGIVKTFPITNAGQDVTITMQGCLSPFDSSSIDDSSTRKSLTLRLPLVWEGAFEILENDLIALAAKNSQELFGTTFTEEALRDRYKPISKKSGEYPRQLRAKLVTDGFYACRYWSSTKQRIEPLSTHAGEIFNVALKIRGIWVSNENFGLVCDLTDLQTSEAAACPF